AAALVEAAPGGVLRERPEPGLRESERREPPQRMIVEGRADSFAPVRREHVERAQEALADRDRADRGAVEIRDVDLDRRIGESGVPGAADRVGRERIAILREDVGERRDRRDALDVEQHVDLVRVRRPNRRSNHAKRARSATVATTDENSTEAKLRQLEELRDEARHAGSERSVERQKQQGKLLARERAEKLLDPGSFVELDRYVRHREWNFGMAERRPYGD